MRISDWSSDVCSSDLPTVDIGSGAERSVLVAVAAAAADLDHRPDGGEARLPRRRADAASQAVVLDMGRLSAIVADEEDAVVEAVGMVVGDIRSEEHTSELQSLMRNSYAVFVLKN